MSSKKQQQYIVKGSSSSENSTNSVPPRYQPPPLPPGNQNNQGILKHPPPPNKDGPLKLQQGPPLKHPQDNLKNPQYYPLPPPGVPPPTTSKPFPGYLYPPGGAPRPGPPLLRQPPLQQPLQRPYEEEVLRQPPLPEDQNQLLVQRHHQPPPVRFSDDELLRLPQAEMLKFVRKSENETSRLHQEHGRHLQGLLGDLRALKEANQRLGDDNQELRDLCCFLDDDRQKGRKLAREWQRFGRYTASVMRQEVSAYQSKLRELDNKQQELIKDNLELKELCLYLDEERGNSVCQSCGTATNLLRDDGDGSSSSTNADEPAVPGGFTSPGGGGGGGTPRRSASRERLLHENLARQRSTLNDQTMQYVRTLEQRVKQLEDDKRSLALELSKASGENVPVDTGPPVLSGRPEAVVRALQVLEVREQLERDGRLMPDNPNPDMDEGEKALVREMCNVVWRKLEEGPPARR